MTGPLPPAVGGMASVIAALSGSSLAREVDLQLFETGKTTPESRPWWQGIRARLQLMASWWRLLGSKPRPLVHIHTCSGLTYFLDGVLLLMARMRGARVVMHIHGARFDDFLDGLGKPALGLARWLARSAHWVVVLSEDWRKRLGERLPGAHLQVVANGVPAFPQRQMRNDGGGVRFLFLGNLGRRKGVHVLLQAAKLARHAWRVDLAGGEEEPGFVEWTQQEIERLDMGDRVRILGPIVGDAKTQLLLAADGFVLPSLAEGLPMALLEAMAARLPVVVTAVGAMPEVVRDGVEGYLVPAGDAEALALAIDRMAESAGLRLSMGEAAFQTCDSGYGVERMVRSLLEVYAAPPLKASR